MALFAALRENWIAAESGEAASGFRPEVVRGTHPTDPGRCGTDWVRFAQWEAREPGGMGGGAWYAPYEVRRVRGGLGSFGAAGSGLRSGLGGGILACDESFVF